MRYMEVIVNTPAQDIDRRCEEMSAMGVGGFVIENEEDFQSFLENNHAYWDYVDEELEQKYAGVSRIKCYLTDDEAGRDSLRQIRAAYGEVAVSFVEDSDWENNWREYYKPIEVGEMLVVVPEWEPIPEDGRKPLRLDPGLIFGTGSHPTTRLCLAALENSLQRRPQRHRPRPAHRLRRGHPLGRLSAPPLRRGLRAGALQHRLGCDHSPLGPGASLPGAGRDLDQLRHHRGAAGGGPRRHRAGGLYDPGAPLRRGMALLRGQVTGPSERNGLPRR